jgi:penicillin-binding protein 1C
MKRYRKLLTAWVALAFAVCLALRLTPVPAGLCEPPPRSVELTDRAGRPLRGLLVEDRRFARPVAFEELSPHLIAATLSAEDKRFWSHPGVDLRAVARAARDAARQSASRWSGASTITQQLIKVTSGETGRDRSLFDKGGEMWRAVALELRWPKHRILSEYLNRLDYGNLQTGVGAASRYYFGKPPGDVSPAEAALLAALPKAPGRLNPHLHPEQARERQRWVLRRMAANNLLDAPSLERALAEPLRWRSPRRDFEAPHFVDLLLQRRGTVAAGGGEVRTTLDLELNRFAAGVLTENLAALADKHATSGSVVVIENRTGDVLALTGPNGDFEAGTGEVNGAWSIRSPGSAMKPFTYLLALERGANPCTVVPDVPTGFATETGIYRPNNYNHRFHGPVSLRFALGNSLNVAAIRALELAGGPDALQRAMIAAGTTTLDHPSDYYGLGLTLGNGEVRLLELANAYATLARLGLHLPYRLLRPDAESLEPGRRVFDSAAAYLLAEMLADNSARAASFGLASFLSFDFPVACKTGTSSDYRDNWAIGYTPEFTVGVWVGNADGSRMRGITGVTGAAPVMHETFEHLRKTRGTSWFTPPRALAEYTIDPLTGRLAPPGHPAAARERCLHPPAPARAEDYDGAGRTRLPSLYAEWLGSPQNALGSVVAGIETAPELRILAPAPGSSYFLDADLPAESQSIPLRAEGAGQVKWSSASLPTNTTGASARAQLSEGRHTLVARDTATGAETMTWIEVKRW